MTDWLAPAVPFPSVPSLSDSLPWLTPVAGAGAATVDDDESSGNNRDREKTDSGTVKILGTNPKAENGGKTKVSIGRTSRSDYVLKGFTMWNFNCFFGQPSLALLLDTLSFSTLSCGPPSPTPKPPFFFLSFWLIAIF